jgi:hypothetical protein
MDESTQILLDEYKQVRDSERASRSLLLQINTLAIAVVSGLLLAIIQYKVEVIALFGPIIFYFVGFFYSAEALRLLSLVEYARRIERALRIRHPALPAGFEDTMHPATGVAFLLRYNSGVAVAPACFYGIFYLLFFYLTCSQLISVVAEAGYHRTLCGIRSGLLVLQPLDWMAISFQARASGCSLTRAWS